MSQPTIVTARLNDKCQPAHRARYEDPLNDLLKEKNLGHVDGGGSQLDGNGEVAYCEISIALRSADPGTLQVVADALARTFPILTRVTE
jgi:hypothetical protein